MKKLLTFLTLLTLFTLTAGAETESFDFSFDVIGADGWTTSYADHTVEGTAFNVYLSSYNKMQSGSTITGIPVSKGGDITVEQKDATKPYTITGVYIKLRQWGSKAQTVSLKVSDDGSNWSNTDFSSNNFELTATGLSTKAVRFKFSSQQNQVGLESLTITYTAGGGSQTTVATPVITLNPASGPYYVGDNVTASIACDTEGATLTYSLDNGSTWQAYSSAVTIPSTTAGEVTITAKAAANGEEATATKTVTFGPTTATVAEILQLANHTTFKFTGNLVVSGKSGNQLYAQDATGGMHFYGSTPAYAFGDVIPAGFVARFVENYNGAPELDNMSGMVAATETAELNAEPLTPSQITTNNENAFIYAVIKNATIANNTITANGETVTVQNTFNVTLPTDGKSYDFYGITNWNNEGRFIPLSFEETYIDPGEGYYLVGNFSGWKRYENYKFTEAEGSLILNNVTLPDNAEFKIVNKTSSSEIWYGGQTDNTDQANLYVLHGGWHTDIPLTNSENNNYVKNFSIAAGGVTSFTLNTSTMKFDALRDAQVYFTCDKINNWAKAAMTATDNGWTITKELEAGAKFAFIDEWGGHHGNDWTIKPEHYGDNYNIPLGNANTPTMQYAGYYKIDVNSALTVMHVNKEFAINCSANPNGGGNVTAKVGGETVESAMSGETVTIEYTTANGYTFNNITLNGTALEAVEGVYSFTMPNEEANVVANFTAQSFAITVDSPYGTTTCPETATTGSTVTFTVTPETDYEVISVTASFVNGENTTAVTVNYNQETGEYSFNMPPFPVTVKVNYKAPFQSKMYQLITSADDLEANLTYLVVCEDADGTAVMGNSLVASNKQRADRVVVTPVEGIITSTSEMAVITLGGSEGAWTLLTDNGYIGSGSNIYNTSAKTATISFNEDNEAIITQGSQELRYNKSSNWFQFYNTTSGTAKPYIFKEVTPESKTLAQIVQLGATADGKVYTISDENGLLGVYKSGNTVWFKDEVEKTINLTNETLTVIGGAVDFDEPGDEQNYWIENKRTKDFDQSNWIEVDFTNVETPEAVTGQEPNVYIKNLTGTYSYNGGKRKLVLTKTPDEVTAITNPNDAYVPNPYIPANFYGTQQGYFFSKPKVQEYAKVVDAQWNGTKMVMGNNNAGFVGSFTIEPVEGLTVGNYYTFHGIISRSIAGGQSYSTPRLQAEGDYDMITTDLAGQEGSAVTAISTVGVNGEVKSVKYVSVAGVVSDRPFQGVNIVVTEYTDGTRTTAKVVK